MSIFTNVLLVSPLDDGKTWVLRSDFRYHVGQENSEDFINVENGFLTDFASVPRLFWVAFPKWGKYGNASIIHDWLYWTQTRPRAEADKIFLEAMAVSGVHPVVRYFMYQAVNLFGWAAWMRNEEDMAQGFNRQLNSDQIASLKATVRSQRNKMLPQVIRATWRKIGMSAKAQ
jgi:hypothetical protein